MTKKEALKSVDGKVRFFSQSMPSDRIGEATNLYLGEYWSIKVKWDDGTISTCSIDNLEIIS